MSFRADVNTIKDFSQTNGVRSSNKWGQVLKYKFLLRTEKTTAK